MIQDPRLRADIARRSETLGEQLANLAFYERDTPELALVIETLIRCELTQFAGIHLSGVREMEDELEQRAAAIQAAQKEQDDDDAPEAGGARPLDD